MHHSSSPLKPLLFFLFLFINFPSHFSLPFFNNIALHGDAFFISNAISLTQQHHCPFTTPSPSPPPPSPPSSSFGVAVSAFPIRFRNPETNTTASFSCRFSFTIVPAAMCPPGDGMAFIIVSNVTGLGFLKNEHLGILPSLQDRDSFLAVEFDTHLDVSVGDVNKNHVGIDVGSGSSMAVIDAGSKGVGIELSSGKHLTAWIEYRDEKKVIKVWISYFSAVRPSSPALEAKIDLSDHLNEFMYVGFSASNGVRGSALHVVDRWRFKTFGLLGPVKEMEVVDGDSDADGYCFMCSDEEIEVGRYLFRRRTSMRYLAMVLGGFPVAALCVIAVVFLINAYLKRREGGEEGGRVADYMLNRSPARWSLSEVKSVTGGFNKNRIVGEGASAVVYLGCLPSMKQVAVKRFRTVNGIGGCANPFSNEFATMACCLRHMNLVQLLGWCCEHKELALVYEYMPNGSLERVLHECSYSVNLLTWELRLNIILGTASALTYLHEGCDRQIIHRDIKSCNILLDADFTAKLSDFGLAEIYDHTSLPRAATVPAGTMGYLAPEYVYTGVPTVKTDVYSFGVVILEVASGRRCVDSDGIVLGNWVWGLWERGALVEAVDSQLRGRYSRMEMERMLKVGLWCVHPDSEKRPTVREAARMLRGERRIPLLPARKPKLALRLHHHQEDSEQLSICVDDDTAWLTPRTHFY